MRRAARRRHTPAMYASPGPRESTGRRAALLGSGWAGAARAGTVYAGAVWVAALMLLGSARPAARPDLAAAAAPAALPALTAAQVGQAAAHVDQAALPALVVDGETVVMSGTHAYDSVSVRNGGVISVGVYAGVLGGGRLELAARRIAVDASSRISADGAGWRGIVEGKGEGPGGGEGGETTLAARASGGRAVTANGAGRAPGPDAEADPDDTTGPLHATGSGAGGGYGGRGGDGIYMTNRGEWTGGRPYGTADGTDAQLGSAGGAAPRSHHEKEYIRGGNGGGFIRLQADQVQIDGRVSADGEPGYAGQFDATGGGAGGAVLIEAIQLTVNGRISASGAPGGQAVDIGGAGGGGRLKITARAPLPDPAHLSVRAGQAQGPCPGERASPYGCDGTLHLTELPKPPPIYLPLVLGRHCIRPDGRALALVMDTSHSMQLPTSAGRPALEAAVAAADAFVARFGAYDRAGLVGFNSEASVLQPLTADHASTRAALRRLATGSGSRLDLGLRQGQSLLQAATPSERKVLILLTDGVPTGTDVRGVRAAAAEARAAGITVYALGFGTDVDAALLGEVAGTPDRVLLAPDAEELTRLYDAIAAREVCR